MRDDTPPEQYHDAQVSGAPVALGAMVGTGSPAGEVKPVEFTAKTNVTNAFAFARWSSADWRRLWRSVSARSVTHVRTGLGRVRGWIAANTLQPTWLDPRWRSATTGYVAAAVGQVVATLITLGLLMLFPGFGFPGALPFLITIVIALSFGAGPSLFAVLCGMLLLDYAILTPHFVLSFRTPADQVGILLYLVVGSAISVLASQVARSQWAAALAQKEALAARAEAVGQADLLQSAFDAMGDAVLLYDADRRLIKHNVAVVQMFGFDDDPDFATRSIDQRYAESTIQDMSGQAVPLDQLPQVRALRGETLVGNNALDLRMRHSRDGHMLDVNVTAAPVRDVSGQVIGSVSILRDVTERRRLEQHAHEALSALLEMAQVLVTASPETDSALVSDESIPPADLAARRLAELTRSVLGCERVAITAVDPSTEVMRPLAVVGLAAEQEAQMWASWPDSVKLGDSVPPESVAQLRAGNTLTNDLGEASRDDPRNPYHARSVLVAPGLLRGQLMCLLTTDYASDPHVYSQQEQALAGAVIQLVALVIERERLMRERAQAEARELALRAAHEQMDQFLSLAGHELRTPLTTMKANVQIAVRRVGRFVPELGAPPEPTLAIPLGEIEAVKHLLTRTEQAIARQERLVGDLLDVSRIQTGKLEYNFAPLDLRSLARDAIDEQRLAQPRRTISLALPEQPVLVWADGDRIRQVLANYLINALRYSPVDCAVAVTMSLETDSAVARVSVRDEGPGIATSQLERIWERFYRAPGISHTSGSGVGLGLGLFISREIIERHGGKTGVYSKEGNGAEFWFIVPLTPDGTAVV